VEQGRRNEGNGRQREDEDKPESRLGADLPAADIATVEVIDRPRGLLTSPEGLCGTAVEAAVAEADDDRDGGEGGEQRGHGVAGGAAGQFPDLYIGGGGDGDHLVAEHLQRTDDGEDPAQCSDEGRLRLRTD